MYSAKFKVLEQRTIILVGKKNPAFRRFSYNTPDVQHLHFFISVLIFPTFTSSVERVIESVCVCAMHAYLRSLYDLIAFT